jgi:hypothetical protein
VLPLPRSAAWKTILTVCPAHGVIGTPTVVQTGRSVFAAPNSTFTWVRTPASSSTNARNQSDVDEFALWAK